MSHTAAIFKKQIKDTFKNSAVLIQFVLFPVLTLIMSRSIAIEGMPENFFVSLFASMYAGMAPLTSMTAVIAEEKENNTLRVLRMSNVKPWEYLLGTGAFIWLACVLGAALICAAGHYGVRERLLFMAVMAAGIFVSLLLGAAIGTWSKSQLMATSVVVPVMMVFSFMPMLSMFNAAVAKAAKYLYSEQISILLSRIGGPQPAPDAVWIFAVNLCLFAALFAAAYKKCGLE